jgi:hypothetical protein
MRFACSLLPGIVLLTSVTNSFGQTTNTLPIATTPQAESAAVPRATLFKVGLNPGRNVRGARLYNGLVIPVTVGAEHMLGSNFSIYGQVDADLGFYRDNLLGTTGENLHAYVPTGALGLGARYYYNQAARARDNRAHGAFNGNYLALEAHNEVRRGYYRDLINSPSLNIVWGMQRRLGRNFLFDLNAGAGVGYGSSREFYSGGPTINTQLNLGIYFGH